MRPWWMLVVALAACDRAPVPPCGDVRELWRDAHAREALRALAAAPVHDRGAVLAAALRDSGLDRCKDRSLAELSSGTYFGVELARVGASTAPVYAEAPSVRVGAAALYPSRESSGPGHSLRTRHFLHSPPLQICS